MPWTESYGGDGALPEAQWAQLAAALKAPVVTTPTSWRAQSIPNVRQFTVSAGTGVGFGVLSASTGIETFTLDAPPSTGSRTYLLVVRRQWAPSGVSAEFKLLPGPSSTVTAAPENPPTLAEATDYTVTPGIIADHPIAWIHVNTANNTVKIWDLRRLARYTKPAAFSAVWPTGVPAGIGSDNQVASTAPAVQIATPVRVTARGRVYIPGPLSTSQANGGAMQIRCGSRLIRSSRWHTQFKAAASDQWMPVEVSALFVIDPSETLLQIRFLQDGLTTGTAALYDLDVEYTYGTEEVPVV